MRIISRSLYTLFLLLVVASFSKAVPKAGLWHLIDAEKLGTLCFVHFTGEGWKVYDSDWTDLNLKVNLQGDRISFELPVRGSTVPLKVAGVFSGTDLTGRFTRFHVQYSLKGTWKTRFIGIEPGWTPLEWARSLGDTDVVDIGALVVENMPFSGKEEFVSFWETKIETRYYPILTQGLYADYRGAYLDHLRVQRVNRLFQSLPRGVGMRRWLSFQKRFQQVQSNLGRVYPWMNQRMRSISLPTGGLYDFRFIRLNQGRERVLLFSVDWWAANCHGAAADYFVGQGIIYGQNRIMANLPENLRMEIARRGIAAYLSQKLAYSDGVSDTLFLGSTDVDRLQAAFHRFKQAVGAVRLFRWKEFHQYFLSAKRSDSYFLGYQFAASLARELSPSEMVTIHFSIAVRRMNDFLRKEQAELVPIE